MKFVLTLILVCYIFNIGLCQSKQDTTTISSTHNSCTGHTIKILQIIKGDSLMKVSYTYSGRTMPHEGIYESKFNKEVVVSSKEDTVIENFIKHLLDNKSINDTCRSYYGFGGRIRVQSKDTSFYFPISTCFKPSLNSLIETFGLKPEKEKKRRKRNRNKTLGTKND